MRIQYSIGVRTAAGWRDVSVIATAEKISPGMARVVSVETIDGETPNYRQSRTGAKRQQFDGRYWAAQETGKRKRLSTCESLETDKP